MKIDTLFFAIIAKLQNVSKFCLFLLRLFAIKKNLFRKNKIYSLTNIFKI